MLEWIARGLRTGIVTTRYPRRARAGAGRLPRPRSTCSSRDGADREPRGVCPTGAISVARRRVALDRGRCILCGALRRSRTRTGSRSPPSYETAARTPRARWSSASPADGQLEELRATLGDAAATLRRSIHIRHVDAGSDGAEEWEIQALTNPYYDMQRLGLFFTLSPRHADVLLVTGGVTEPMRAPLLRAWEVMPEPKAVVAAGTDACSGGFAARPGDVPAASTACCRSTSTCPARRRARSRSCTGCCSPPASSRARRRA